APTPPATTPPPTPPSPPAQSTAANESPPAPSTPAATLQPATPPPPAQAVTPPPSPQVAAVNLDLIRRQLAQLATSQRCAAVDGDVRDGGAVTLTGLAGNSSADSLRQGLSGLTIPGSVEWQVQAVDQAFCPALDVVHPIMP